MKGTMKLVLGFSLASFFITGSSFGGETQKKKIHKSNKSKWCCMVDTGSGDEMALSKNKPICLRSSGQPTSSSKSKLTKKYVKTCKAKKGTWAKK